MMPCDPHSMSQSSPSPPCSPLSPSSSSRSPSLPGSPGSLPRVVTSSRTGHWLQSFEVPWHKMSKDIQVAIANCQRPPPDKRRQMIHVLADEIRRFDTNPTRRECLTICENIVRQHPSSFADMTPAGVFIGGGYTSLLSQVKTRIENLNRGVTTNRHRSSPTSSHKRRTVDSYGCAQFDPEVQPDERETLEMKRQQLASIYGQEGMRGSDRAEVIDLMQKTFPLQRSQINQTPAPSIEDLKAQWPYLFTQKGIFAHFESLTGISILHALDLSISECGQMVERYLRTKLKNTQSSESQADDRTLQIIKLLMAYFNEDPVGLMLLADVSITLQHLLNVTATLHTFLFLFF